MSTFDYKAYLASREWALKRKAVKERSGGMCERVMANGIRCQFNQSAVHHKTYAHIGNENLDELMAICADCHAYLSGETDVDAATMYWCQPGINYEAVLEVLTKLRAHGIAVIADEGRLLHTLNGECYGVALFGKHRALYDITKVLRRRYGPDYPFTAEQWVEYVAHKDGDELVQFPPEDYAILQQCLATLDSVST